MTFVQIIEMTTTKASEIEELTNGWIAATEGRRSARRSLLTKDRERPDTYVQVVEFPSYEEAMANSALPETTAFAEKLSALCSSGPTFRNLDLASTSCSLRACPVLRIQQGIQNDHLARHSSHVATSLPGLSAAMRALASRLPTAQRRRDVCVGGRAKVHPR
jgi:hypothetical protein